MKLKKLLEEITDYQVHGSQDITLTGVSANSKLTLPGYLFIAKRGQTHDGGQYIAEAVGAGAHVIVTDHFTPSFPHIVQVIHPDVASIEAALAAGYYQHPSQDLLMVGITGTNGKTTTSFIIKHLLDGFCGSCGLIGTIEYIVGTHRYPATRTTPDVTTNHKMLREMLEQGCRSAVMEVTSHALNQGRVDKIDFDVAIFSNLTLDHLDYHETMENYCQAKNRLFRELGQGTSYKKKPRWAIVNQDSPWTSKILEGCQTNVLTYGIEHFADLYASSIRLDRTGTSAQVTYQGQTVDCFWPLVGRFNVYNCLAAMAVALTQQFPLEEVAQRMTQLPAVRGRLQAVENSLGLKIYVDFAHSDDALMKVLETLKELQTIGRLIVVFGCGGDRDRTKRPKMAKACERYADLCLVTSDNPRSEDPHQICEEIVQGFTKQDSYEVEVDRRRAIQKAIEKADVDDIILIAGKGHEPYQIFAHETIAFDDCQVAAEICAHLQSFKRTSERDACFA
jgi:UDP-N-acetylmuramoyl-L-alanyl-D-glutamate--2,6-diaminopimelate ligase